MILTDTVCTVAIAAFISNEVSVRLCELASTSSRGGCKSEGIGGRGPIMLSRRASREGGGCAKFPDAASSAASDGREKEEGGRTRVNFQEAGPIVCSHTEEYTLDRSRRSCLKHEGRESCVISFTAPLHLCS